MQQVKVLLAFMDRGEAGTPPAVETFAAVAKKVDSVTKNLQDGTSVDIAQTLNTDVEYLTILKKIAGLDTEDEGIDFTEGDNLSSLTTLIMKTNASSEGIADPDKWMKDEFAKLSDEIFPPDIDYTRLSAIDTTVMAVDILKAQSRRQNSSFSLRPDNLAKDEPTTHRVAQAKYLAENAVKKFTEASKGDEPALHLFDKKAEGLKKKVDEIGAAIVKLDEKKTQLETDMRALKVERSNLNFGRMIESGDFSEVEGLTKKCAS